MAYEYVPPIGAETLDYSGRKSVVSKYALYDAVEGVDHVAPFVSIKETYAQQASEVAAGRGQRYWKSKEEADKHPELVALARKAFKIEEAAQLTAKLSGKLTKAGDASVKALKLQQDVLQEQIAALLGGGAPPQAAAVPVPAPPPAPVPSPAQPAPAEAPGDSARLTDVYDDMKYPQAAEEYLTRFGKSPPKNWTLPRLREALRSAAA